MSLRSLGPEPWYLLDSALLDPRFHSIATTAHNFSGFAIVL